MAFQQVINIQQALAVEGDFCNTNPRHSVPAMEGAFKAGATGVTVGRFAWADVATNTLLLNSGTGAPTGFLARVMNALNFSYFTTPGATTMVVPSGFPIGNLFSGGDFWVKNNRNNAVVIGMKAFANLANGAIGFQPAATVLAGYVETKWFAQSAGAYLELIQMSDTPLG